MFSLADDDWSDSDESISQKLDELCRMIVVIRAGANSEHIQLVKFTGFAYTANSEFLCRVEGESEPKWIAERDLSLDLLVQLRSAGVQFAVDKQAHRDEVDGGDEKDDGDEEKDGNDDDLYTVLSASRRRPEVTLCFSARYWPEIRGKDTKHNARLRRKLADLSFPADWTGCTDVLRRESEYDYWVTESCAADLFHVDGVAGAEQRLSRFMVDAFRDAYERLVPREVQQGLDLPTPVVFTKGAQSKMVPSTVDRELAALVEASKRRMETAKSKDSPTKKSTARSKATSSKPVRTKVAPIESRPGTALAASIRRLQSAGKRVRSDSETEDESAPVQRPRKRQVPEDEPTPSPKKRAPSEITDEQSAIARLGAMKAPRQRANMPPTPGLEPIQSAYRDTHEDRKIVDLHNDDSAIDDEPQSDETEEMGRADTAALSSFDPDDPFDLPPLASDPGPRGSASTERTTAKSSNFVEIDHISAYRHHSPPGLGGTTEANNSVASSFSESKDEEDLIGTFINTLPRPPPRRSPRRSPMRDEYKTASADEPVLGRSPRRSPVRDERKKVHTSADEPVPRRSPRRSPVRDEHKTARADEPATPSPDAVTLTPAKRVTSRAVPDRSPSSDRETRSMSKRFMEIPVTGVVLIPRRNELDFPNDASAPPPARTSGGRASRPTARGGAVGKSRRGSGASATRSRKGNN